MAIYMFSYDLNNRTDEEHEKDSQKIKEAVSTLGTNCKFLTTTYLLKSNYDIQYIYVHLTKCIKEDDRMLLCEVMEPFTGSLLEKQWQWIRENLQEL